MAHRQWVSLTPQERAQVVDDIHARLEPMIGKAISTFLSEIEPKVRQMTRNEIGKFAVTETQARAFLDGMIREAAEKAASWFRPRWMMRLFFQSRI